MAAESDQHSAGQIYFQIDMSNQNIVEWRSNEEMIGEFKWCIKGRKLEQNGETLLSISICCNEDCCLDQLWLAKVDFSLESQNIKHFNMKDAYFYNGCDHGIRFVVRGAKRIMHWILKLKVFGSSSNTKIMALDIDLRFLFPNNDKKNKEIEKVIAVNKYVLAGISGYFHNLFFGDWSERSSNSNTFFIKEEANFDWKAFALMVYSSMAMGCMVHESGILNNGRKNEIMAMAILKLSIKYDMPVMQNNCEKHLIQSEKCTKIELLELAEQFGLQKLIEHALRTITPLDIGEDFGRYSDVRAQLSEKNRDELDKRLVEKTKELKTKLEKKRLNNGQQDRQSSAPGNRSPPRLFATTQQGLGYYYHAASPTSSLYPPTSPLHSPTSPPYSPS